MVNFLLFSWKVQVTDHRLFAQVAVNTSHFVLVHLVQLGMNLQTEHRRCRGFRERKAKNKASHRRTTPTFKQKGWGSYPLFGIDDVLPQELLRNGGNIWCVVKNHILHGNTSFFVAGVMFNVRAHHEACQHLILAEATRTNERQQDHKWFLVHHSEPLVDFRSAREYLNLVDGVSDNTQHVKTRHDRLRQVHVLCKGQGGVVSSACEETDGGRQSVTPLPSSRRCDFQTLNAPIGLQAAITVHLACSDVTMPALEMEMLCCSMASWMLVLSASFIWGRKRVRWLKKS